MSNKIIVDRDDLYGIRWGINSRTESGIEFAKTVVNKLLGSIPTPSNPTPIDNPPVISPNNIKVAIVVGHNSKNKGACAKAPLSECEFDFNNKVADELVKNPPSGVICKRFNRIYTGSYSSEIDRVYSEVNKWNPVLVLELHFNAGGGKYSTMVVAKTSNTSIEFGKIMQSEVVSKLGVDNASLILADRNNSRGGRSVFAAKAPVILTEPFFGDNIDHCNKIKQIGHSGLANIYKSGIDKILNKIK